MNKAQEAASLSAMEAASFLSSGYVSVSSTFIDDSPI
jgi:hypothetical protein